jgi:uncharacterized protein YndB with AHSA1/START domain
MILKIAAVLGLALAAFLIYVAMKPSHVEIARSIEINAPPAKVFPYVNDRRVANQWNPFLKQDPTAKITLSGPDLGVGAKTSWEGGKQLGVGSAEVVKSVPNEEVLVQLDYQKPFKMRQLAGYRLEPVGTQTRVTWKVAGENNFMARLFCSFMDMDKQVGSEFAKGLAELKRMVEQGTSAA